MQPHHLQRPVWSPRRGLGYVTQEESDTDRWHRVLLIVYQGGSDEDGTAAVLRSRGVLFKVTDEHRELAGAPRLNLPVRVGRMASPHWCSCWYVDEVEVLEALRAFELRRVA